jgi:hypothetical protein
VGLTEVQYKQIAIKPRNYVMKRPINISIKYNLTESVINRLASSAKRTILLFLVGHLYKQEKTRDQELNPEGHHSWSIPILKSY